MKLRTPATSLVAALDEPFRFLRTHFHAWAPATYALALLGVVPGLLTQWFNTGLTPPPGEIPNLGNLAGVMVAGAASGLTYFVTMLGAYVVVGRVLDGERPTFGAALLGALSPRLLLIGGMPLMFTLVGFGCLVGGPVIGGLVGFTPVAVLARPGQWAPSLAEALSRATERVSPRDAGLPAYKLGAITLIWYAINSVTSQLAALPTAGWMIWHVVTSLGAGDPMAALQTSPPFAVGTATVLLGTFLRPFADIYLAAGATLLWRDLERVREGADLEAVVDAA